MENAVALAAVMGPVYVMVGLSVLLYAKSWQSLLDKWGKDHYSAFTLMLAYAVLGLIVVRMYNVWEGNVWVLVTLTGWAMLLKAVVYFLLPGSTIKSLMALGKNMGLMYLGGLVATVVGAVLSYQVYFAVAAPAVL